MNYMKKPVLFISAFVIMMLLISCSGIEIQFQPKSMYKRPKKILICPFENRMLEYNPYIVKDFRDALKFEFLKQGYDVEIAAGDESNFMCSDRKIESFRAGDSQKNDTNPVEAARLSVRSCCEKYTADILIKGSISVLETGELTDSKTSTVISIVMYNKFGEQIGEARYSGSGHMNDAGTIKKTAHKFAEKIHSELRRLQK